MRPERVQPPPRARRRGAFDASKSSARLRGATRAFALATLLGCTESSTPAARPDATVSDATRDGADAPSSDTQPLGDATRDNLETTPTARDCADLGGFCDGSGGGLVRCLRTLSAEECGPWHPPGPRPICCVPAPCAGGLGECRLRCERGELAEDAGACGSLGRCCLSRE